MNHANAMVMEAGQPRQARYMGTHVSGTKHYMEIRYGRLNSRKWIPIKRVTLHEGVTLRYCDKVAELNGQVRALAGSPAEPGHHAERSR